MLTLRYRGFSYSAVFWDCKETALWEIRTMGELFKYYLLIKRDYRISKVHFFSVSVWLKSLLNKNEDIKFKLFTLPIRILIKIMNMPLLVGKIRQKKNPFKM